ncbi:MAG: hypothetical protein ISR87_13325 [Candidatus Marinimicrobia bacterium]|nr:hypothetical protein [FCB group bacterium]MBL7026423.1 hypothetical protein [Candidatus Neomarinimicrobiota bacterium]
MQILQSVFSMAIYFIILIVVIDIMRKHYRFANIFWIASLLTFPLWLMNVEGWFRWVKILSVILPTIFVGFARIANYEKKAGLWSGLRKDWIYWFLYSILFLNIFEATVKDVTLGNYWNALCGFILCATIPYAPKYWTISKDHPGDLIAYTTPAWNLLYTSWNACFVYAESPVYFASSLCILLAAELYPVIRKRPELYIMARIYTLAFHLILRASFDIFPKVMDSSSWSNPEVLHNWGIVNVMLHVPFLFWFTWQLHTGKFANRLPVSIST